MQHKILPFPAKDVPQYPLPVALPSLIGREREVREVRGLLLRSDVRLLTLTGPGGVGKTRLAIEVARNVLEDFADGVCFVSLAPLSDPEYVMPAIAQALCLKQTGDSPLLQQLQNYLRHRHLLLALDNFEQVAAAAPYLIALLTSCPDMRLLVTSRATLHLPGEQEYPVPPLNIPDLSQQLDEQAVAQVAAVQLFAQRARAVQPTFRLTTSNASTVAAICARLDGLPLALELAAARIKLLPPQDLLKRLESPLDVLSRGASSLPSRQQTIRNTIMWSYDLLDSWEQRLFRLCSVFVGGFTLQALEAVCMALHANDGTEMGSVLEGIDSLVNKSLLLPPDQEETEGEPRLGMLETVREYGRELLLEEGEMEAARRAHGEYYLGLVEQAEPYLNTVEEAPWIQALERDLDNVRAVIAWSLERGSLKGKEIALRLGAALWYFWVATGRLREGVALLEQALIGCEGVAAIIQAKAFSRASILISYLGEIERSEAHLERSLALYRELGDSANVAYQLRLLGWRAHQRYNFDRARSLYEESMDLYQSLHDEEGIHQIMYNMAYLAQNQGDYERARTFFETVLAFQRRRGHRSAVASNLFQLSQLLYLSRTTPALNEIQGLLEEGLALANAVGDRNVAAGLKGMMGCVAFSRGDLAKARLLVEETLHYCKQAGREQGIGDLVILLARINMVEGQYAAAGAGFEDGIAQGRKQNDLETLSSCLIGLAQLAVIQKQFARAVHLLGAEEKLREAGRIFIYPVDRAEYDDTVAAVRTFFGEQVFARLWAEGQAMSIEEALASQDAEHLAQATKPAQRASAYPDDLSAREVEVLRLLAQGFTDAQIAEQLIISPRTVNTHLTSIYRKIQVTTRAAATRYAIDHQLV